MVACKTVGEYKRNQEKIKKLCLEEAKQKKIQERSAPINVDNTKWTPEKVRKAATKNLKRQQMTRRAPTTPKRETIWGKTELSRKRTRTPKKSPLKTSKSVRTKPPSRAVPNLMLIDHS